MTRSHLLYHLRINISSTRTARRHFSQSVQRREIRSINALSDRIQPEFHETRHYDLLSLEWPAPPRNVLLVKKDNTPNVTESFVEFAKHISSTYPGTAILLERDTAQDLHKQFDFPVYTDGAEDTGDEGLATGDYVAREGKSAQFKDKVDLVATLGGDGTILHASSLFSTARSVPPLLAFSMGTLGFLGEWKFRDYKSAFREVYMSGAGAGSRSKSSAFSDRDPGSSEQLSDGTSTDAASPTSFARPVQHSDEPSTPTGWSSIRGKAMGSSRGARVLLRNRLQFGIFGPDGERITNGGGGTGSISNTKPSDTSSTSHSILQTPLPTYALNEVIIHRGRSPHLAIVEVRVGGRFLTEAVADGMIISTPTGSTAYSLSSGGSIVHPLVPSLLLTPVCPRSLSFRPLVLPGNTPISLRLSPSKNRAREVEVSVDGVRRADGLAIGMEIRVSGEEMRDEKGKWVGGVPSIVRGATTAGGPEGGEDNWVGGLNGLLKFNYPFGEEN